MTSLHHHVPPPRSVLLAVDMQLAFDEPSWGRRGNPDCDANGLALLAAWRQLAWPIVHVRHDSVAPASTLRPERPGHAWRPGFGPVGEEAVVAKSVNAAFIGTDLDLRLRRLQAPAVVVFGITTDMCVSTTVRVGANLGWPMIVAADACATFDLPDGRGGTIPAETVHEVHLATLGAEFARVMTTAGIVAAVAHGRHDGLNPA